MWIDWFICFINFTFSCTSTNVIKWKTELKKLRQHKNENANQFVYVFQTISLSFMHTNLDICHQLHFVVVFC